MADDRGSPTIPDQRPIWEKWHDTGRGERQEGEQERLRLAFAAQLSERSDVLDLGCGAGHDTVAFAEAGHRVTGVDFAASSLERLKARAELHEVKICSVLADLRNIDDLPAGPFDAVWAYLSLHYFDDDELTNILGYIHTKLRVGGRFGIAVKNPKDPLFGVGDLVTDEIYLRKGHLRRFLRPKAFERLLRRSGLTIVEGTEVWSSYGDAKEQSAISYWIGGKS